MNLDDFPMTPFHLSDAAALGLTPKAIWRAAEAKLLVRVGRGTYRRIDVPDSVALRVEALRRSGARHEVVVDRTAAWIHGVDVHTLAERDATPRVETCSTDGHNASRNPEIAGRERDLAPGDVMQVDGMRVTTPLRTALDVGCHVRRRDAFGAMCILARLHGFTSADLVGELPRFRRRRGVVQCRQLAALVDARLESYREAWVLLELHDEGLPRPEPQWWVEVDGVPVYRLDFAYPAARVYVEYDGEEFHDLSDEQRTNDLDRRTWLREAGWTGIVVRRGDFTGAARERWLRDVREALGPSYTTRRWPKW